MRTREIIKLMPTQFRQTTTDPLDSGHYIPMLGYWTKDEGYVKKQSLEFEGESLACPVIAVVNRRVGKEDLTLTITAKVSEYDSTEERTQGEYTIKRKTYTPTETTIQTDLTVPRFTRQWATFLLTGLGKMVYEITSIDDDDVLYDTAKIEFYALASAGSRIIYWLGLFKITEILRDIVQGPWLAPTKCLRCSGTGIEPGFTVDPCKQCTGYGYSGYNATRYVQRNKGFDVGLARTVLEWDNMTDDDHQVVKEFINKAWTQKWWVTPTKKEIKRLFAHFFQLSLDDIQIEERFHLQEPVWTINLPRKASLASPFGRDIYEQHEDLLIYMAESVTPAGVSVFVGFYDLGSFGDFSEFATTNLKMYHLNLESCAFEARYMPLITPRWSFWNGWTEAIDHFERCTGLATGYVGGMWTATGQTNIINVNDINRHMVQFEDNSYLEHDVSGVATGQIDFWVHPQDTEMRFGLADTATGQSATGFVGYVAYKPQATGFFDNWGTLIRPAMPHCDYHVRIDFVTDATGFGSTGQSGYINQILIDRKVVGTGFAFLRDLGISPTIRFGNTGQGTGYIDAYGNNWTSPTGYSMGDNYQRLYPKGWGICNSNAEYYYKGTYSFRSDDVGWLPYGWVDESDASCDVFVVSNVGNHGKIVKLEDGSGSGEASIRNDFGEQRKYGTIEIWIRTDDITKATYIWGIRNDDTEAMGFKIDNSNFYIWSGMGWDSLAVCCGTPSNDTWHHIKFEFRCSGADPYKDIPEQRWWITVDGVKSPSDHYFGFGIGTTSDISKLRVRTESGDTSYNSWFDAVGYVWKGYIEGDNYKTEPTILQNIRADRFWEKFN